MNHSLKITFKAAQARSASWPRYLSITRLWHPSGPSDVKTFAVKKPHQLKISVVIPVKKNYSAGKLTTVLLSGNRFFPGCWFLRTCYLELAKLSAVSIWRQSQLVRNLDLDYLRVKQTYKQSQTKKIVSTFRVQFPTRLCICIISLSAPWYSLRYSLTPLVVSSSSPMTTAIAFY